MDNLLGSKTEDFLATLNDTELAFLLTYKLKTYTIHTQNKILQYCIDKGYDINKAQEIVTLKENELVPSSDILSCPRCNSEKILTNKIDISEGTRASGYDYQLYHKTRSYDEYVCNVCDYTFHNSRKSTHNLKVSIRNLWRRIFGKRDAIIR